ncbi:MAG: D-glycero-beta-D-manno-heptose-7-phosphate kinase [Alphaproteobacteria bacterium]
MSNASTLAAHIEDLDRSRVLCVGDLMLDRFVYGEVQRISPEAPIPVFRVEHQAAAPGGAGNVVRNVLSLGASACFIAVVGDDPVGHELIGLVGDETQIEPYLLVERNRRSTLKTRYVAGGQQLLRADSETTQPISQQTADNVIRVAADVMGQANVVILSDYAKGVLTPAVTSAIIADARAAEKPVVVDPKGTDFGRYQGASVLTPNWRELAEAVMMPTGSQEELAEAARAARERFEVSAILVTRGAEGMSLVGPGDEVHHLAAEAREVFDVSGAGDTVIASFSVALGQGTPMPDAVRLANLAAGIVVGKVGTAVVYRDDLVRALHASELMYGEAKIMSPKATLNRIVQWRRAGEKIGFTNGCFDLLHPGHVALLAQARAVCDRLVVGLNSDASAARFKGRGRPIQSEIARAQVLASLATVDVIVIFGEDTPMKLIEAIRPEVLVKGADYRLEEVVGADFVQAYGGKVVLAEIRPGHSTSATIARLSG